MFSFRSLLLPLSLLSLLSPFPTLAVTPAQLLAISPSSSSCSSASFAAECRTSSQAAPHFTAAFERYGISSPNEQAAILALVYFESGDLKYNKNHFPGVPGQGTRNMQSPAFNLLYAKSIPAVAAKLNGLDKVGILNLLMADEYSFASAAWFVKTQCANDIRKGLEEGSFQGWVNYLTKCIGTTSTDKRTEYWKKAIQALKAPQPSSPASPPPAPAPAPVPAPAPSSTTDPNSNSATTSTGAIVPSAVTPTPTSPPSTSPTSSTTVDRRKGCPEGMCRSKWGFCGSGTLYCGTNMAQVDNASNSDWTQDKQEETEEEEEEMREAATEEEDVASLPRRSRSRSLSSSSSLIASKLLEKLRRQLVALERSLSEHHPLAHRRPHHY